MCHVNFFKGLFESVPDYRKIVLIMFLIKNDFDISHESGYLEKAVKQLCLVFPKKMMKQRGDCSDFKKKQGKSHYRQSVS